jgi:membrane dipeptidase
MMQSDRKQTFRELREGPFTLEAARAAGVRLFFCALYCEDRHNGERAAGRMKQVLDFTLRVLDEVPLVKSMGDLKALKGDREQVGTLLLLENADALAGELSLVDEIREQGVCFVGLTHAGRNRLADGNGVRYPEGLSDAGRKAVQVLGQNGRVIDTAHLHPRCFWQVLDLATGPVINSHTGIRRVCDLPRNLDLDQAGEIAGRGGVMGITFNPEMLRLEGRAGLEDVFVHMDHVVQKLGPECVGVGSDFYGFHRPAEGLEDVSKVGDLAAILLAHGYGEEAVRGIMGENWLRLLERLFTAGPGDAAGS